MTNQAMIGNHDRLQLARQCVKLVREIADCGANCGDLMTAGFMNDLPLLYSELSWVNGSMQDLTRGK